MKGRTMTFEIRLNVEGYHAYQYELGDNTYNAILKDVPEAPGKFRSVTKKEFLRDMWERRETLSPSVEEHNKELSRAWEDFNNGLDSRPWGEYRKLENTTNAYARLCSVKSSLTQEQLLENLVKDYRGLSLKNTLTVNVPVDSPLHMRGFGIPEGYHEIVGQEIEKLSQLPIEKRKAGSKLPKRVQKIINGWWFEQKINYADEEMVVRFDGELVRVWASHGSRISRDWFKPTDHFEYPLMDWEDPDWSIAGNSVEDAQNIIEHNERRYGKVTLDTTGNPQHNKQA